ncbi:MAG: CPBP family intramembrane glutamic endopeptidase [Pseudomonadota bacterium]
MTSIRIWFEFLLLFIATPLLVYFFVNDLHTWLMPILVLCGAICIIILLRDKGFSRRRLYVKPFFRKHVRTSFRFFALGAVLSCFIVWAFLSDWFFAFPRQHPEFWLWTLAIYPLISVVPQEIIFRTFFFHRYKHIMPSKLVRLGTSSLSFGFAHLVYGNWIAVVVSALGGLFFGYRYLYTRCTAVVVVEHTLWGALVFTVGFGVFFVPPL